MGSLIASLFVLSIACTAGTSPRSVPTPIVDPAMRQEITVRIDRYSPDTYPLQREVGESAEMSVTFTNMGVRSWQFDVGASVWDCAGRIVADYERMLENPLDPDEQVTVSFEHTIIEGPQWIQFGVWQQKPYRDPNLIERAPSPAKILFIGGDQTTCE